MVLFYRHPLYPFCMGMIYKFFGVNPKWDEILALIMYSIIIGFLPLAGTKVVEGRAGFFVGLAAAVICLICLSPYYHTPLQTFTTFFAFICFLSFAFLTRTSKWSHFICGILTALTILSKGVFVLLPAFYVIAILAFASVERSRSLLKVMLFFVIGFGLAYLPWFFYTNDLNHKKSLEMALWAEKITASLPSEEEIRKMNLSFETEDSLGKEILLRAVMSWYMLPSDIIITTNQLGGNMLLAFHNELSIDGGFRPEGPEVPV